MFLKKEKLKPQKQQKSIFWYKSAAENGMLPAQYMLGKMYHEGNGVRQNYEEAFRWHEKAAFNGFSEAQYYLGRMYFEGEGVPKNVIESFAWFSVAHKNGLDCSDQLICLSALLSSHDQERAEELSIKYQDMCLPVRSIS